MSVNIHIHKTHRQHTNGQKIVSTKGQTVGDCILDLINQFPEIRPELFENGSKLKKTVEIYLNMENAYPDELAKAVTDGDDIHLTLLLAGG